MYPQVDHLDTGPARDYHRAGPFTVPEDFAGSSDDYKTLIRERYRTEPEERMLMHGCALWTVIDHDMKISGPYANEARAIMRALLGKIAPELLPSIEDGRQTERKTG